MLGYPLTRWTPQVTPPPGDRSIGDPWLLESSRCQRLPDWTRVWSEGGVRN